MWRGCHRDQGGLEDPEEKEMRLIDADELKRLGYALTRTYPKDPQTMVYETKNIDDIPTIDPVKHGRWSIVNIYITLLIGRL